MIITYPILGKVSSLDVHSLDHSMELWPCVAQLLPLLVRESSHAQSPEVLTRFGCEFAEQFNNDFLLLAIDVDIEEYVLPSWGVVYQLLYRVIGFLLIYDHAWLI